MLGETLKMLLQTMSDMQSTQTHGASCILGLLLNPDLGVSAVFGRHATTQILLSDTSCWSMQKQPDAYCKATSYQGSMDSTAQHSTAQHSTAPRGTAHGPYQAS